MKNKPAAFINATTAAKRVNVPRSSFYRHLKAGRIAGVSRLGPKTIRVDVARFERWLRAGGFKSGPAEVA